MEWTPAQRDELAREYTRIGIGKAERVPTPASQRLSDPVQFLALLRAIPDGAGVLGILAAYREHATGTA
jgi:hypothetical protein